MMKAIVLTLPVANERGALRTFTFHGYGDPTEVVRHETYGYTMKLGDETDLLPVWYLNGGGFAQKLNLARPPYRKPACDCRDRVLLVPVFDEGTPCVICKDTACDGSSHEYGGSL